MASRSKTRPVVRLAHDELQRGPWVFARHVAGPAAGEEVADGELVRVEDASGRFVGHALYNGASDVRLRFLSRGRKSDLDRPRAFLAAKLREADKLRRRTLSLERVTDAYRVAHAEGDDLPGLVVDRLADHLVCEHHALGFLRLAAEVEAALGDIYPRYKVVHRVPKSARKPEGIADADLPADAEGGEVWVREHGLSYPVRPGAGHKTGFFCDQRDNRRRVGSFCGGRDVLDLFCNLGGFGQAAAREGARRVRAVDLDEQALAGAARGAERNGLAVETIHADAFDVLRDVRAARGPKPDVIVLDPHKLVVGKRELEKGLRKYADLNALALEALAPGGLLATFSCSGALDLPGFLGMVFGAARRAGSGLKLLEVFGAAPDHPQRPDWPRSRYLKGALVFRT